MKQCALLMNWLIIVLIITNAKRVNKASCSVSSITIPVGTNTPVMVYNARLGKEIVKLTVLGKEHLKQMQVTKGKLLFTEIKTGDAWYADNTTAESALEVMKDAIALCQTLHQDNKMAKSYDTKVPSYARYTKEQLPDHVSLKQDNAKQILNLYIPHRYY